MATRVQKVKVGVFLVFCFVMSASGMVLIAGLYEDQGKPYTIEFEESVLGVYEGGMVEYLGVPIGKVKEIRVSPDGHARVDIVINPRKVTLHAGVEAQLVIFSLAAGTMAVSLNGGDPKGPVLPDHSQIPAKRSTMTAVSSRIEELMDNLTGIAETVKSGLQGMQEGDLNAVVDRVNSLLDKGNIFLEDTDKLVGEASNAVTDLRGDAQNVIDELLELGKDVRELTKKLSGFVDTASEKVEQLDVPQTQAQLNRVLENIGGLTEKLNNTMGQFDKLSANMLHKADNVDYSLRRSLDEISQALEAMRMFVDQLRTDPSSLVRGKGAIKEQ